MGYRRNGFVVKREQREMNEFAIVNTVTVLLILTLLDLRHFMDSIMFVVPFTLPKVTCLLTNHIVVQIQKA